MRTKQRSLPSWSQAAAVVVAFAALAFFERKRPLRRPTEPLLRRDARNLIVAAVAAAGVGLVQPRVVDRITGAVERRRLGALKLVRLPRAIEIALAVALMDYTLYVWHRLTHAVDLLWRFHEPHHTDLDLSASTALRFHFGEMLLSIPFRAAQVRAIGVSPLAFSIWQTLTVVQILFHHSNVRLPLGVERGLCRVLVTPRLHGIHHSDVRGETDSNFGTIFSLFDRWHGTLRLDVPQREITVGVPAYRSADEVTLGRTLALPFVRLRHRWTRPGQEAPQRPPHEGERGELAP